MDKPLRLSFLAPGIRTRVTTEALNVSSGAKTRLRALDSGNSACAITGKSYASRLRLKELPRALTAGWPASLPPCSKRLGFKFGTLDLEGFRSGSMNQLLSAEELLRGLKNNSP